MAKKVIDIDTKNVDINLEKDGTNVNLNVDSKNLDISYVKDELNKEFKLDGKNIDVEIKKTAGGIEVKVDSKGGIYGWIAKRILKFILKRFKIGK